ncbi:MAG TPA: CotH kinase family protein [Candidatus Sabulitectum sp.]|nr:CotH kinase family protein [Candidatus Sabulitectum sp.]HPJ27999.1 CotH kinase family protein [Candidatus Sabulitectum sp.]HPR21209.1 CotH kinase family protein [Candidatus Sabulitectum sp.]HRW77099.1 CotH kinase family protein [Candidatus Sabulitectum sp.]
MHLLLLAVLAGSAWPDTVPVVHLEFDQEQWEYACDHYWEDIYLTAELTCGGYSTSCQFRIRGATSREYPKKSIKVEFPQGTFLFGADELNLNAEYLDRTRFRELLSYLYYRRTGQTVPEAHLVEVVFNGETQGPYVSVQDVDEDFLLATGLPDDAVIYKCADRYTTLDRPLELEPYTKKTHENDPWDDLKLLIYWLLLASDREFEEGIHLRFHYEDLVSAMATNVLLGHGSTYYHNYHLILERTGAEGPWRYVTWDMDRTWGKYGPEFPYWKNSSNNGNRRNTLVWRMWCNPSIRNDLIQEIEYQYPMMRSMVLSGTVDSIAALAAPMVENDPFRDYTMENYWGTVEAVKSWPDDRYSYLQEQFSLWPLPFRIVSPVTCEEGLDISWSTGGSGCTWEVVISPDSLFTHEEDIVYSAFTQDTTAILPPEFSGSRLWLQVYGTRNGSRHRSSNGPLRLETPSDISRTGSLVVTEINYQSSPALDPGDWFEITNPGEEPVALGGWSLRDDDPENLSTLDQLIIQPGEAMVFAADTFLFMNAYGTLPPPSGTLNFNLRDQGDAVVLRDPSGDTVDSLFYHPEPPWPDAAGNGSTLLLADILSDNGDPLSWVAGPFGGTPFGTGSWDPEWPQGGAVGIRAEGPLPAGDQITFLLTVLTAAAAEFEIRDLSGRTVVETVQMELEAGSYTLSANIGELPPGVYFAVIRNMGWNETLKFVIAGRP